MSEGVRKVKISEIKEHISCFLCKGYLIEATTIIECLHTFCKDCIVKYLNDSNNTCPKCDNVIHQSHPLQYISFDRTMQDIVYKLLPNLEKPKEASNDTNSNVNSSQHSASDSNNQTNRLKPIDTNGQQKRKSTDYHRNDEQINLVVLPYSNDLNLISLRYIRTSIYATVTTLRKYVARHLFSDEERYKELDLLCNDNLLGKDHNFKLVSRTEWREKEAPIIITYRRRVEFQP